MKVKIPIFETTDAGFEKAFERVRAQNSRRTLEVEETALRIVESVRRRRDRAVVEFTKRFDGLELLPKKFRVDDEEIRRASAAVPASARAALRLAARRIRAFHQRQKETSWRYRDETGVVLGQMVTPLKRVGIYVPGGRAAYPSSVLMNALPARVAGVSEIVMVSPAGSGGLNPAVLTAAGIAGVTSIFRIGGAQAVAALAFGTETIPRVDKIVGPGNAYVQAAKKLVYGHVDIDAVAGPSEVVVIADESAVPAHAAADLLAQAEHGSGDECAILLTPSRELAEAVCGEICTRLDALPRRADIAGVLRRRGALIVVRNMDEAVELAERVAPEHLELLVRRPRDLTRKLHNAGAIFEGTYSPVPLGDYLAGPNHVLPTGGTARFFSPLGVYDFMKRTSIVAAGARALQELMPAITELAELEGYTAHAAAVRCRFES